MDKRLKPLVLNVQSAARMILPPGEVGHNAEEEHYHPYRDQQSVHTITCALIIRIDQDSEHHEYNECQTTDDNQSPVHGCRDDLSENDNG
jgi:hypothetical protein